MSKRLQWVMTFLLIVIIAVCFCGCAKNGDRGTAPPGGDAITGGDTDSGSDDDTDDDSGENTDDDDTGDNTGGDNAEGGDGGYEPIDPMPTPTPTPMPSDPKDTKTTVYYTNQNGWSKVYAYLWNYSTGKVKSAWPGEALAVCGYSGYGETQYSVDVDYSVYDRVIFNDGNGNQTKDLVIGGATSGYYGYDGVFTMGTDDYGTVRCVTLTDAKNLSYISGASKKISVYTPSGYTSSKKYGVLYMFDSQSLYIAADGADKTHSPYDGADREYWAADVAVTNLVKNGGDGVIIVAVDNTDGHRDSELTMSQSFGTLTELADNSAFYNGKLDELGNFMRETLMPWVNANYSVDTSREKTGIAGSSSGGLAAYYLGLRDNDLYGYIGAFSPANALFTASDWTRFYNNKNFGANRPRLYVYCGKGDDLEKSLYPASAQIKNLTSYGFASSDIIENYVADGTHNEVYWRIAFTEFLSKMIG